MSRGNHFSKEIYRVVVRNLTFDIVLQNKCSSFYSLVMFNKTDLRQIKPKQE